MSHLVLKLEILDIFAVFFVFIVLLVTVDLDFQEEVEERFLLDLLGLFLFLLVLLLDDLDSDVLSLLPVDLVT